MSAFDPKRTFECIKSQVDTSLTGKCPAPPLSSAAALSKTWLDKGCQPEKGAWNSENRGAQEDDDRTTSMGLFNTAEAYRLSARALERVPVKIGHADKPVQFLYAHAIELYLKALLRQKHGVEPIRESFGHNTKPLVKEAEKLGLFVTAADRDVFAIMEDTDALIEMRYIRTGAKTSLNLNTLSHTCKNVQESVGGLLRDAGVLVRLKRTGGLVPPACINTLCVSAAASICLFFKMAQKRCCPPN